MKKVIKGEFEIIKDVKVKDVSLTFDTPLEVFNNELSRLSRMDDDLFTYKVEVANIPCDSKMDDDSEHEADDDMGYDLSDVAFTEWDDEVEFTNEEFFDNEDEVAEVFRIDTNLFELETPMCKAFKEFNYLLQISPDLLTKQELFEALELPVCNIRKFKMIKYSFGKDEEYVAVKEDGYDDLARTSNDACRTYQKIFRRMDEGWMVTRE
nr:hypothetical protein [Tanacetum cinerariifolium]